MAKILITGGAGYIGSILVSRLLAAGHLVTAIDNFMYNQTPLLQHCISDNFIVVRGDATDEDLMARLLPEADILIPLACLTGAPLCSFAKGQAYDVIVHGAELISEYAPSSMCIIYPTTNSGYGIGGEDMCTEESPLSPVSEYGVWKCEAESTLMNRRNTTSLRLATAFGVSPRMRMDLLVNDFVYRAVTDRVIPVFEGHYRRNFIHVSDICGAIMHCIKNWDTMKNQTYNVGLSSANMTKLQLADKIAGITGAQVVEVQGKPDPDKRDYLVSNEKLERTGWRPVLTLDDGIRELVKAYKIIRRNQYANI
jgi:nucleoside-diphosphate-sugar epimerase